MYRTILVPTDGTELSARAIAHAGGLAKAVSAKVVLFHAAHFYQTPALYGGTDRPEEEAEADARKLLDAAANNASLAGVAVDKQFVISDFPSEAVIEAAAKSNCDLIVMASHGRRGMSAVLLGSETQKVLTHSKVPVLVVR